MKLNKAIAVYFSPTGNSKKCALATAGVIGRNIEEIDLTKTVSFDEGMKFDINDFIVFSAPVYGGRLFKGFAEKLHNMNGNFAKCIGIVTYGNRDYDDALLEMKNILIDSNFIPLGFGAIVGRHTYGHIQTDRPDNADLENCRSLAKGVLNKIEKGIFTIPFVKGNFPYKDGGNGGSFYPQTDDKCKKCGLCAKSCPQGAISFDDFKTIDTKKCISCFRCIRLCPFGAKVMETKEYLDFADMFSKKLSEPKEDELFI